MNKIFEEYRYNAWDRRIVRDYPKMPEAMQKLFLFSHYVSKLSIYLALVALVATAVSIIAWVDGSWLFGGSELLSESPFMLRTVFLGALVVLIRWVIPGVFNFYFEYWYQSQRSKF